MRFAVEAWAPEYGSAIEDGAPDPSVADVDPGVEAGLEDWAPRRPDANEAPPSVVCFVDGVRRVDARVWVTPDSGSGSVPKQGLCASWAAGVVRCDRSAELTATQIGRGLFCPVAGAEAIVTRSGRYRPHPVAGDDPDALSIALQGAMADLEHQVSAEADACTPEDGGLLVLDGPLRQRHRLPGAVGFVKTHHRTYLPEPALGVVGSLADGERTPVFLIGGHWGRWSWYLRLPGERTHPWAGVVRCEASLDVALAAVTRLADRVTAALPRFASTAHKDPRAPQNLYPIAGLERELRRRLGDPALMVRSLRQAAHEARPVLVGSGR